MTSANQFIVYYSLLQRSKLLRCETDVSAFKGSELILTFGFIRKFWKFFGIKRFIKQTSGVIKLYTTDNLCYKAMVRAMKKYSLWR